MQHSMRQGDYKNEIGRMWLEEVITYYKLLSWSSAAVIL
jgi:hypothetical protein